MRSGMGFFGEACFSDDVRDILSSVVNSVCEGSAKLHGASSREANRSNGWASISVTQSSSMWEKMSENSGVAESVGKVSFGGNN